MKNINSYKKFLEGKVPDVNTENGSMKHIDELEPEIASPKEGDEYTPKVTKTSETYNIPSYDKFVKENEIAVPFPNEVPDVETDNGEMHQDDELETDILTPKQ